MILSIEQIAAFTAGTIESATADFDVCATGITWDSRDVSEGDLYVALPGERVDGHDFVPSVISAGACVVLVSKPLDPQVMAQANAAHVAVVQVESTSQAITDLARGYRTLLAGTVLALTGSTGKTTTKNFIRDVLSAAGPTVATHGNRNNELGVPRTVLEAAPDTRFVVVEMGMRGRHQIDALCDFVRPDMALITNVGESHIELLGSRENIACAKAEIVEDLPAGAKVFLNTSDDYTDFIIERTRPADRGIEVILFDGSGISHDGRTLQPAVYAENITFDPQGRPSFTLKAPQGSTAVSLQLRGAHNVHNAVAAAAVGLSVGMTLDAIAQALAGSLPEVGRQEVLHARNGAIVINDAYNANPDSMRASLSMFSSMDVPGKRYAVLGDMGELGAFSVACHEGIGRVVADSPIDELVTIGELSRNIARAACEAGMDESAVHVTDSVSEACTYLEANLDSADAVLVKASHSMELDRVVRGLVD